MNQLLLVLFAANRRYFTDDKTALRDVARLERAPRDFEQRVQRALAHLGESAAEHPAAIEAIGELFRETVELVEGEYQRGFSLRR